VVVLFFKIINILKKQPEEVGGWLAVKVIQVSCCKSRGRGAGAGGDPPQITEITVKSKGVTHTLRET